MNDHQIVLAAVMVAAASVGLVIIIRRDTGRAADAIGCAALVLFILAVTSWAAGRDREASAEERAAAEPGVTVRHVHRDVVEFEHGRCWAVANVRRRTYYSSCSE